MTTSITIRRIDEADFVEADAVLRAAFEQPYSFLPNLRITRAIEPDGLLLAEHRGAIVGTVGAACYGALAYVGFMAVRPNRQGRGIGRLLMERLLDWLDGRACPMVLLDATPKGAALYETMGFVDDHQAFVFERGRIVEGNSAAGAGGGAAEIDLPTASPGDLDEIAAFDARAFGADRKKLLTALWDEHRERCLIARGDDGTLSGYLFARDPVLGPWVATNFTAADALLATALALPRNQSSGRAAQVMVPRSNRQACELLTRRGFSERRRLRHMRRGGTQSPGIAQCLYGQSSFAHG